MVSLRDFAFITLVTLAAQSCRPEPIYSQSLDDHVAGARGLAPAVGRTGEAGEACELPDWVTLHPDETAVTWPRFHPVQIELDGDPLIHPLLSDLSNVVMVLSQDGGLENAEQVDGVLLFTSWIGTEFECGVGALSDALLLTSYFSNSLLPSVTPAEAFDAFSAQADEVGLTPVGDLDVALPCGNVSANSACEPD